MMPMGQMGLGMGQMGQMGLIAPQQHAYGGAYGAHQQPTPHPAAAAAFNAAAVGRGGDEASSLERNAAKDVARRERRGRKEREMRERGGGGGHTHKGPLSPHRGNANADEKENKESKESRRRERDERVKHAAEEQLAALEATHRVAVKGLQRRVTHLEHELAAKDETFENERMRLELEVNRAIIDKVEAEKARLDEERAAMQADLQSAIQLVWWCETIFGYPRYSATSHG